MSQITYTNKDKTSTDGIINKWRDVDATEVKTAVNTKEDVASGIVASGTDTYTATDNTGITTYVNGQKFLVKFTNANTGAATLNINSLGAKAIKKSVSTDVASGDILAGQELFMAYDGTNFQVVGGSGGSSLWSSVVPTINPQTTNYTLVLADKDKTIEMNVVGANTVTVPANATVGFAVGTQIAVIQYGAGATTIVAAGGVTINASSTSLISPGQYSPMLLEKRATNEWYLFNGTALVANWALTGSSQFTGAVTIIGTATNTLDYQFNALGTTVTDGAGLRLANNTDAAAGAQQISPVLTQRARGWKTNATAASQTVDFHTYVLPVQGAANPYGIHKLGYSVNGAAYTDIISTLSLGTVLFGGSGSISAGGSSAFSIANQGALAIDFYSSSGTIFATAGTKVFTIDAASNGGSTSRTRFTVTQPADSSAWAPAFTCTSGAHTSMTASTAFPNQVFSSATLSWVAVAGTIAAQKDTEFRAITHTAATSGTMTDLYNTYFENPLVSGSMTATRKWSIGSQGNVNVEKNLVMGTAALATNATDGFIHVSSSAGAPVGTPTTFTGRVPLHVDTTNNFLYLYIGGAWKKSTVYA